MWNFAQSLLQAESLIVVLSALAVFATIFTIVSPLFSNDKLAARTKLVTSERDRLKAASAPHLKPSQMSQNCMNGSQLAYLIRLCAGSI